MGKVNQLFQEEQARRWQQHYDDWCVNNVGGREPCGSEHEIASAYADDMMEEEDDCDDEA